MDDDGAMEMMTIMATMMVMVMMRIIMKMMKQQSFSESEKKLILYTIAGNIFLMVVLGCIWVQYMWKYMWKNPIICMY